jgi:2'-phosphotransferase
LELNKVISAEEIPVVIHGTYFEPWATIKNDGLSRMSRNHIHFASGIFGDNAVISGMFFLYFSSGSVILIGSKECEKQLKF